MAKVRIETLIFYRQSNIAIKNVLLKVKYMKFYYFLLTTDKVSA